MSKAKVFELAKQLHCESKRLMEKLEEIGIKVKSHMSVLEEAEIGALYKHIGMIKPEPAEKQAASAEAPVRPPEAAPPARRALPSRVVRPARGVTPR